MLRDTRWMKLNATVDRASPSRKRHKMRQRYVTTSFPHKIPRCSRSAARVLNPDRSHNESTEPVDNSTASIEPQSSDLIDLVDLSACPPTLKDRVRLAPFVFFSPALSLSFAFARIIPFLLYHRLALLICPSPFLRGFKTRRCSTTKRVGTNSISRQKHRAGIANDTANGVSNIAKIMGGTIECSRYTPVKKNDAYVYTHKENYFIVIKKNT